MKLVLYLYRKIIPLFIGAMIFFAVVLNLVDLFMNIATYLQNNCLGAAGLKEMQSQLVSLCNAERYPNTLVFISTKAVGLYKKMLELVK